MKLDLDLMGEIVTVTHELKRVHDGYGEDSKRYWEPRERKDPRAGWVTGYRFLQNGVYKTGYRGYYDDVPYLKETEERTPCILVVYWPTTNHVYVPLDGYEMGGEPADPMTYYGNKWFDEGFDEFMKDVMEDWPRDEKGRWISHAEAKEKGLV